MVDLLQQDILLGQGTGQLLFSSSALGDLALQISIVLLKDPQVIDAAESFLQPFGQIDPATLPGLR